MGDPFLSEIRIFSFANAPRGWAQCNGQLMPINQNQALFSLLGTQYGGDGRVNFALPDLRGRVAMHMASTSVGTRQGEEVHTVTHDEMPTHTHAAQGTSANAATNTPSAGVVYARAGQQSYGPAANLVAMAAGSFSSVGGSQPHENRQPYLVLNVCICLAGIFPSQN